jgi:hypothetical protein
MVNIHKSSIGGIVNFTLMYLLIIFWYVHPLQGNDREISNYTTAVTRQRSVNSSRGKTFSVGSVPRCLKEDKLAVK